MAVTTLRGANRVRPPVGVRALADLAGLRGDVSLRTLVELLGPAAPGPTPVYLIGHNTNTIADARRALDAGANALEIDVTAYASNLATLCVDHAGLTGDAPGGDDAPRLEDFLRGLRTLADERPRQFALVVFDCKPPAATPGHGQAMLDAARRILTGATGMNLIVSVADVTSSHPYKLDGTTVFDRIASTLGPREGLMIDADADPEGVARFFGGLGVGRFCYGHGTSFPPSDEAAMVYRTPIERACWRRVAFDAPRFVYAWTINNRSSQQIYLQAGVDGVIADLGGIAQFRRLLADARHATRYRMAVRRDNPFLPPGFGYALAIRTSDVSMGGTDAHVTIELGGARGSARIVLDAALNGRLESGSTTYAVVPSPDLGDLSTITVRRDGSGNAPDWHLASIAVDSRCYGFAGTSRFDCWIGAGTPVVRPLR